MFQRRTSLAALAGLAALPVALGGISLRANAAQVRTLLDSLRPSPRMPVLFVGHGSPMNAIEDNLWRRSWQQVGQELSARSVQPQLILCISAHWLTKDGWYLTGMSDPRTIHDFSGFPRELHEQQYPAPGAPAVARALAGELRSPADRQPLKVDEGDWGLDHGTWSVLKPMFPKAQIPVIQLSMDYARSPEAHFALGRQLGALRERGVLIVGSGNAVHNLRRTKRGSAPNEAYDWATEFDEQVQGHIKRGELESLVQFQKQGELARLAHPTHEHYLPLLYAAGAASAREMPRFFNTGFQSASISMRSVIWG